MNTLSLSPDAANLSLGNSFSIAAGVVLVGVFSTWAYLQQSSEPVIAHLPEIPAYTVTTVQDVNEVNWLERAEQAFMAGRISAPEGDSALYYYQKTLQRDAGNLQARKGVERVTGFLVNAAESAVLKADWVAAEDLATQAMAIAPENRSAISLVSRVNHHQKIRQLEEQAVVQVASGNLTKPKGSNALASYRAILAMDPGNAVALQGIDSVAQRLATLAQTEAFAENHTRARELIALAKEIAPHTPGIAQTEKLTLQWSDMVKDQAVKEDLLAAAEAMQADNLVGQAGDQGPGALTHYRSALTKDPDSRAARSGIQLVINGLIERAWLQSRDEDLTDAEATVALAVEAGAETEQLAEINSELNFLHKRQRARAGKFDEVIAIGELQAKRRTAPVLPRGITEGWVELLFTVNEEGDVEDVVVVDASGYELYEPAVVAVGRWRFEPYRQLGRTMPVRSGVRFTFQS
ncbi:MAG: TonB family protein [Pseudomonadota bacterium]